MGGKLAAGHVPQAIYVNFTSFRATRGDVID